MTSSDQAEQSESPKHIAIIMDGNGRWAKKRSQLRVMGHRAGVGALRNIVRECRKKAIPALTVFAFSSENWQRPRQEVGFLMDLFLSSLAKEVSELATNNVRLQVIGDRGAFPSALQDSIRKCEEQTAGNTGLILTLAANYGGRWDIVNTARMLARRVQEGQMTPDDITVEQFNSHMALADLPEPDLFIRTGGDQRISNYMLWQLAYTELYFTDVLWPDFTPEIFNDALSDFANRQRRFGRTGDQIEKESSA